MTSYWKPLALNRRGPRSAAGAGRLGPRVGLATLACTLWLCACEDDSTRRPRFDGAVASGGGDAASGPGAGGDAAEGSDAGALLPEPDAAGSDASADAALLVAVCGEGGPGQNLVFVSSKTVIPGQLGSVAAADAHCQAAAAAAGLGGTFWAYLSDGKVPAHERFETCAAWVRRDGHAFTPAIDELVELGPRTPLLYDEYGTILPPETLVLTNAQGGNAPDKDPCGNFASVSGTLRHGASNWVGRNWSSFQNDGCGQPVRLACFQANHTGPLVTTAPTGRVAFLTEEAIKPSAAGRAAFDALCQKEAAAAGLAGTFVSLVSTREEAASARLTSTGPVWMRPDGVPLGPDAAAVLAGTWTASLVISADGNLVSPNQRTAWSGSAAPNQVGAVVGTCADWTVSDSAQLGRIQPVDDGTWREDELRLRCDLANPLMCFQQ